MAIPAKNTRGALAIAVAILLGALAVRSFPASADGGRALPPPAMDVKPAAVRIRCCRVRRRMLLGGAGRLPARQRRDERGVWIRRRRQERGRLRDGEHGHDRARRVRAGDLRSATGDLRAAAAGVLLGRARSDGVEQAGTRLRARSIDPLSSRRATSRRALPRPTSPSSIRRMRSGRRS